MTARLILQNNSDFGRSIPDLMNLFLRSGASGANAGAESTPHSDYEEASRAARGDEDAFRRLVERYQPKVSSMMWRFTRDPINHRELVQDVFVEVFKSLSRYRGKAPLEHWITRIATRTGYRYWKKEKKEQIGLPLEDWDGEVFIHPEQMEPEDAAEKLHALLALLPPRDRLVLTLRYFENQSVSGTAKLTGWSKSMVKVQAARARKKLKRLIMEHFPEEVERWKNT